MKEKADIDQSKMSVRNPDWVLILGVEPHRECEFLNVLPAGSVPEILGCPETEMISLYLFTIIAVFVTKQ